MKKRFSTVLMSAAVIGLFAGVSASAENMNDQIVPTKHNKNLTLGQIADMQPGLGTVMIEYGNRFYKAYYAARAANWDLAAYQVKEMTEIQEVGEATRPEHAEELRAFEHTYLDAVKESIKAKDWNAFAGNYAKAVDGCNACHTGAGFSYIKYRLPTRAPASVPSVTW
jgi:hypothetical protein